MRPAFIQDAKKRKKYIQVGIVKDVMTKKGSFSELLCLVTGYKNFLTQKELQTNMSSDMPFAFNAVELYVVTINERPWTRAREVCKALEYNKKTADPIKTFCSRESYAQKCQLSSVHATCTPIYWPRGSRKDDYYINEEGMCELLLESQQPLAKELAEYMGIKRIGYKYLRKEAGTIYTI